MRFNLCVILLVSFLYTQLSYGNVEHVLDGKWMGEGIAVIRDSDHLSGIQSCRTLSANIEITENIMSYRGSLGGCFEFPETSWNFTPEAGKTLAINGGNLVLNGHPVGSIGKVLDQHYFYLRTKNGCNSTFKGLLRNDKLQFERIDDCPNGGGTILFYGNMTRQ